MNEQNRFSAKQKYMESMPDGIKENEAMRTLFELSFESGWVACALAISKAI